MSLFETSRTFQSASHVYSTEGEVCLKIHAALIHLFRCKTSSLLGHNISSYAEHAFTLAARNWNWEDDPNHEEGKKRQGPLMNLPPHELIKMVKMMTMMVMMAMIMMMNEEGGQ